MKPGEITITMRAVVPVGDVRKILPHLEATQDRVWLARSTGGMRYTFRGVPAKRVDVVVCDDWERVRVSRDVTKPSDFAVVEIGRKSGHFDGTERDRITVRPWNRGMVAQLQIRDGRLFVRAEKKPTVAIWLEWTAEAGDGWQGRPCERWEREYQRLRWVLETPESGGHARIVMYHWSHFYSFLDAADAEGLAASFIAAPGATLAEANRDASRQLYRLSRDLGWCKLTVRERAKLRLNGSQWQRAIVVAERRAALAGARADGVSEASHSAAAFGHWPAAKEV